jgi:hypothetical protein
MSKIAFAAIAGLLLGAAGVFATASSATPRITDPVAAAASLNAGSPSHPQGVRLTTSFGWQGYSPVDRPTVVRIDLWFPRGSVFNGARYPICALRRLNALGPSGCPRGSIMGSGTGTAYADTTITRPSITVVNGGANAVYLYTVLNNPARVQEAVIGHITRLAGRFAYHLSATIPNNLLVVAGVPIELSSLTITAGRGSWLALTSAPAGVEATTTYNNGATTSYTLYVQNT